MITKKIKSDVLKYVRSNIYSIYEISTLCGISHATFHDILKEAGYPRPSTKMNIVSSVYKKELKTTLSEQRKNTRTANRVTAKKPTIRKSISSKTKITTSKTASKPTNNISASDRLWSQLEEHRLRISKKWIDDKLKVNTREAKALRSLKNKI